MIALTGIFKMALFNLTLILNTMELAHSGPSGEKEMFSNGNATIFVSDMDGQEWINRNRPGVIG